MAKSVIFNMAAAGMLDFEKFKIFWQNQLWDPIFCLCVKFCANRLKNDRVMAV